MANEEVKFARGLSDFLPVEKLPGRFLFETDTGTFYLDVSSRDRVPVTDPRLTERLADEFQGTKLASEAGVGPGTGVYFKIVNMVSASIEDLPNFYDEGEDPPPQYGMLMTSRVRQGLSDSIYVQTLFCDTGSVYSRPVLYYSGNYSNEPWVKVGPGAGGASPSAKISTLNPKSGNELSLSSLTDTQLFDSLTSSEEGTIEYWEFSDVPSSISDVPSGVVGIGACDGFTLINALIKRDSSTMRAYYYQQFIAYNGQTFYRSVEQRQDVIAATTGWESAGSPPDATTLTKGIVRLNSQVNLDSEQYAATPKAVKAAYDKATTAYNTATDANNTASDALASAESKLPAPVELLNVDVNTLTTAGMYYVDGGGSTTNTPVAGSGGFLIVNELPGSPQTLQIFGTYSSNLLHYRFQINESWSDWFVINSINASYELTRPVSPDLNTITETGIYYSNTRVGVNRPTTANGYLYVAKMDSNYCMQLYFIPGSEGRMYYRHQTEGEWNPWKQFYSQSNIKYGTSVPSGGLDGDIYIKI